MIRPWPKSLLGQVMASVALALLVAQVISVVLLYRAGEERRETAILTATAYQIVGGAERAARGQAIREERRARRDGARQRGEARRPRDERFRRAGNLPPRLRYTVSTAAPEGFVPDSPKSEREARLRTILAGEGIDPHRVSIATKRAGDDEMLVNFAADRPRLERMTEWRERKLFLVSVQREPGGPWETVRMLDPPRPNSAFGALVFQTLVIFSILIAVLYVILRRITRPLARLTERVSDFSREPDKVVELDETGPADTRRLIAAHNQMEARIAALLDEKDVMLGAIGHDLKTPLAALRVRIESVEDEGQRIKMAAGIEDITATLDDILSLSRVGRDGAGVEAVDLGALALDVAEEFEELGEPVIVADPPRLVARVQITWIKRALRNLVSNAVRYGGETRITVLSEGNIAILRVEDNGPGIAPDRIAAMLEPFQRGEGSRNRATGGAGLGLTLARAIAEHHDGELRLSNREQGGLRAELHLPM